MQTTKFKRPKSRVAVGACLAVFLVLIVVFSWLGDGFNNWSPFSPERVGATLSAENQASELILKDTMLHASLRFGFSFATVILISFFSIFAARELNSLVFGNNKTSLAILLTTFLFSLFFVSLAYMVPLFFYNSYYYAPNGDNNVLKVYTYLIGNQGVRDLPFEFNVFIWKINDGQSFGLFGMFVAVIVSFAISVTSDLILLFRYGKANKRNTISLLFIHLFVQLAVFSAAYVAIVRGWTTLLLISLIAIFTDSFAYFFGRKFGHHQLIAHISSNKTWAGAICGVLGCTALIIFLIALYGIPTFLAQVPQQNHQVPQTPDTQFVITPQYYDSHNLITNLFIISFFNTGSTFRVYWWVATIMIVLFLSIVSIIGDLVFSFIKRTYKIKDFSNLLGSHGGVLDRIDSMAAIFFMYFMYLLVVFLISGRSLLNPNSYIANIIPHHLSI